MSLKNCSIVSVFDARLSILRSPRHLGLFSVVNDRLVTEKNDASSNQGLYGVVSALLNCL